MPQYYIDGQSIKSSNEVRIEFLIKNKTIAMTSKMDLAPFLIAKYAIRFN